MVVFAFSPTTPHGFLVSSGDSTSWENCPPDFVDILKELINRGDTLESISMGCNGDWFIHTNGATAWKARTPTFVSQVERAVEYAKAGGLDLPYANIIAMTFVPDSDGFICIVRTNNGGTLCICSDEGIPSMLLSLLTAFSSATVQSVSVGHGGSWVVVLQNGAVYFDGISDELKNQLKSPGRGIESVTLSLASPEYYLINYEDGDSDGVLQNAWLNAVAEQTQRCILQTRQAMNRLGESMLAAQLMVSQSLAAGQAAMASANF